MSVPVMPALIGRWVFVAAREAVTLGAAPEMSAFGWKIPWIVAATGRSAAVIPAWIGRCVFVAARVAITGYKLLIMADCAALCASIAPVIAGKDAEIPPDLPTDAVNAPVTTGKLAEMFETGFDVAARAPVIAGSVATISGAATKVAAMDAVTG